MDTATKKTVLRMFTYGLYAVTARHGDEASAMTANWITQASFEPPLIALAVEADSHTRKVIEASGMFAVNIYETGQRELAGQLGKTWAKHPEKFDGVATRPGVWGTLGAGGPSHRQAKSSSGRGPSQERWPRRTWNIDE